MAEHDPIQLLFGGMAKLAPGGDEHTRHVLELLPGEPGQVVVDAGCGTGRQTLVLARELGARIHAVDSLEPFLVDLLRRAREQDLGDLVEVHAMDMKDLPAVFPRIDLLWSEGAAYSIGFENALSTWAKAVPPGGFAAVSELTWLSEAAPEEARDFFGVEYPAMQSLERNVTAAERAGWEVLTTYTLPREAWVEGFYDVLEPRARALLDHADSSVREYAAEMIREIEVFGRSEDSYGYVFYVLRHP